jgi:hypothetical protein
MVSANVPNPWKTVWMALALGGAVAAAFHGALPVEAETPTISFAPPVNYDLTAARQATSYDLDGDGILDIAVVGDGVVAVLYGNGDGTFAPRVDYPVDGGEIQQLVAADVTGDGLPELIFAYTGLGTVSYLTNLGARNFSGRTDYEVGDRPFGVTVADFNNDGALDLAVTVHEESRCAILLNDGSGGFAEHASLGTGFLASRSAAGDFNNDGNMDLAVAAYLSNGIQIYLGGGNGNFSHAGGADAGSEWDEPYAAQIITADFNGDGHLDLAVPVYFEGRVSVLFGDGSGSFSAPSQFEAGNLPHIIQSADLDGDGLPEIIIPNAGTSNFSVLRNLGGGAFAPLVSFASGGPDVNTLTVGDYNADGQPDVAPSNHNGRSLSVLLNTTMPLAPPQGPSEVTLSPNPVVGGKTVDGVVILASPAGPEGLVVQLNSSEPRVAQPSTSSITIPPGASSGTFKVKTVKVHPFHVDVTISATGASVTASTVLRVLPK